MNNAIYNFTGSRGCELVNIMASKENGRTLEVSSCDLYGIKPGDTLLLDRPHFKKVPFKVEDVYYLPDAPKCAIAFVKVIDENFGGSRIPLRLKYRHNVLRK